MTDSEKKPLTPWQAHKAEERREKDEAAAHAGALLTQMTAHAGGILSYLTAPPVNDIVLQGTYTVLQAGVARPFAFREAISALTVANFSRSPLVVADSELVAAGDLTLWSPNVGSGVVTIPPLTQRTVAFRGTQAVVSGPLGALFELTAYVRPRPPASSPVGFVPTEIGESFAVSVTVGAAGPIVLTLPAPPDPTLAAHLERLYVENASDPSSVSPVWLGPGAGYGTLGLNSNTLAFSSFAPAHPLLATPGAALTVSGTVTAGGTWVAVGYYA